MSRATQEELDDFHELGFFSREAVFSAAELEEFRAGAEHAHQKILDAAQRVDAPLVERVDNQRYQRLLGSMVKWEWNEDLASFRSTEPAHHLDPRLAGLVDDERLWGPCRALIGHDELSLFSDKLNVKRPGGAPFPWHQEAPYWVFGAERVDMIVSALVYLDDATKENGCLWVIPRSHRSGTLEGLEDRGVLGALYTDVAPLGGGAQPAELPAGSVLYFHHDLVHGSQSNRSRTSRRVFVAAYQAPGRRRWRLADVHPVPPSRCGVAGDINPRSRAARETGTR